MKNLLLLLLIILPYLPAGAQAANPCGGPEFSQFDFWLGDWELTWSDSLHGTNHVVKELNNCVIHENFNNPSGNFSGQSVSVFNTRTNQWEQTWVDNAGAYMNFTGTFTDGKMTLSRNIVNQKGQAVIQRMIYYNINPDSFDWSWEASTNEGKSWKQNWLIHYHRKS